MIKLALVASFILAMGGLLSNDLLFTAKSTCGSMMFLIITVGLVHINRFKVPKGKVVVFKDEKFHFLPYPGSDTF